MSIPHTQLSPTALRVVVEEFVTRDGTDHSPVEQRIADVMRQLEAGRVKQAAFRRQHRDLQHPALRKDCGSQ